MGFGQSAVVSVPAEKNRFGTPEGEPLTYAIDDVWFASGSATENTQSRETPVTTATLWVQRDDDVPHTATVELADGTRWRVTGKSEWDHDHPLTGFNYGRKPIPVAEIPVKPIKEA